MLEFDWFRAFFVGARDGLLPWNLLLINYNYYIPIPSVFLDVSTHSRGVGGSKIKIMHCRGTRFSKILIPSVILDVSKIIHWRGVGGSLKLCLPPSKWSAGSV